jgi:hypothetical protein
MVPLKCVNTGPHRALSGGGCGTFERWILAGRSMPLEMGLIASSLLLLPLPLPSLFHIHVWRFQLPAEWWQHISLIPVLREFIASVVYKASSWTTRAVAQRNSAPKNRTKDAGDASHQLPAFTAMFSVYDSRSLWSHKSRNLFLL